MIDILIIGGGPAGMTAGIYGKRANKEVVIIEKRGFGGQVATTDLIENYPGIESINGYALAVKMRDQVKKLGVKIVNEEVTSVSLKNEIKIVETNKHKYEAKTVIIATGAYAKALDVNGEKQYLGKGISYCATCDGALFKNKDVAVVGGGNSALEDCEYLSNFCKNIYLIHRRDTFRAEEYLINKVKDIKKEKNNIHFVFDSIVTNIDGNGILENIEVKNIKTDQVQEIKLDGLFVAVGRKPDTEIFASELNLNEGGFIISGEDCKTNIPGVYACGDVRQKSLRQIVTACSDGAIASTNAIIYLSALKTMN